MNRQQRRRAAKAASKITQEFRHGENKRGIPGDNPYFWLAIRGAAVPCLDSAMTFEQARAMVVHVGTTPSEQTFWVVSGETPDMGLRSNYDVLIGFETRQAMLRAQATILTAPIEVAHAEVRRLLAAENVAIVRPED